MIGITSFSVTVVNILLGFGRMEWNGRSKMRKSIYIQTYRIYDNKWYDFDKKNVRITHIENTSIYHHFCFVHSYSPFVYIDRVSCESLLL